MEFDRAEMIQNLRLELEVLEKGGYAPSVREPHWSPRIFRDSVSCPNLGLETKVEPCSSCYLIHFVPAERHGEENPCHYIPLNERGDTVASLTAKAGGEAAQEALREWLKRTISILEQIPDPVIKQEHHLLAGGAQPLLLAN